MGEYDLIIDAYEELIASNTSDELESFRIKWLGVKGLLRKARFRSERIEDEWHKKVQAARERVRL